MPGERNHTTTPIGQHPPVRPVLLWGLAGTVPSGRHEAEIGRLCAILGWKPCVVTPNALETGQPERFIRPG